MKHRCSNMFHGKLSIALVGVALLLGLIALIRVKSAVTIIYVILLFVSPFSIAYFYCRNCPNCGDQCPHVLFGRIAALFGAKNPTAYKPVEVIFALLPFACAVIIAQFGLVHRMGLLVSFWVLFLIALIEILLEVCPTCTNEMCALYKRKK